MFCTIVCLVSPRITTFIAIFWHAAWKERQEAAPSNFFIKIRDKRRIMWWFWYEAPVKCASTYAVVLKKLVSYLVSIGYVFKNKPHPNAERLPLWKWDHGWVVFLGEHSQTIKNTGRSKKKRDSVQVCGGRGGVTVSGSTVQHSLTENLVISRGFFIGRRLCGMVL